MSDDAKDFILQCLVRDMDDRPSINDLFEHPWIREIPEDIDESSRLNVARNLMEY